jgi:hypothetical protein
MSHDGQDKEIFVSINIARRKSDSFFEDVLVRRVPQDVAIYEPGKFNYVSVFVLKDSPISEFPFKSMKKLFLKNKTGDTFLRLT